MTEYSVGEGELCSSHYQLIGLSIY